MRALTLLVVVAACDSTTTTPPDGSMMGGDAAPPPAGFTLTLAGTDYTSANPITISAATSSGVYQGYYAGHSDLASVPNLSVSIHEPSGTIHGGASYPCVRSATSDPADETAVEIDWFDSHTYYTNLFDDPACTVTIDSASQTAIAASISGTVYDQTDPGHPASSFSAKLTATVR